MNIVFAMDNTIADELGSTLRPGIVRLMQKPRRPVVLAVLLLWGGLVAFGQTVYVTKSGTRYHAEGCLFLTGTASAISLSDAVARGYAPCSVCNPPIPGQARAKTRAAPAPPSPSPPTQASPGQRPLIRELTGKVVSIHDGDTLTVLVAGKQHKIRLNGIDAPELRQDFGRRSRQYLSDLCFGRIVTVRVVDVDRYGREVGDVIIGRVLANAELVRAGLAWDYKQYSNDPLLTALESEARAAKRGLWSSPHPVPPWEFRHRGSSRG